MGIADGLSRLPIRLMQGAFVEDSDDLRPRPSVITCGQPGVDIVVPCNSPLAIGWRTGGGNGGPTGDGQERGSGVGVVLGEDFE